MATAISNMSKAIPLAKKAEKRLVKLKLAVQGPSGSGKTWGALVLAKNLWPDAKVLVVDTENESASLYADLPAPNNFVFDTIPLDPPFESSRYAACIDFAVDNKYDVLIIDSITHQWEGDGGILRRKDELDRRPGSNSYMNWNAFTPEHTSFIEKIKQAPIHVIATMRSKQEYALEQNSKGKITPVKMGMAPIQREGMDYEFTIVFDVQMDHKAVTTKDRTGLFDTKPVDLADKKVAGKIKEWLESGKPMPEQPKPPQTVAAPVQRAATPAPKPAPAAPAKVEGWTLREDKLSCFIYDAIKRKSKKGAEFIAVKHNGEVNGKDTAFCFHEKLFEALLAAKNRHCVFFVDPGEYVGISDVIEIDGVEFRDGLPYTPEPENHPPVQQTFQATDEDIPF